ncbi:hypothetical protein B296_00000856 [Ensete ventricosum]|uniref:Uncharacterized protein n=1 Tax=Ensete ventricosum TaxID=4639 RepID=A0A427AN78_ENSVE|nr:hypothetical protein B296_00000856 [Ensete ventricosum]
MPTVVSEVVVQASFVPLFRSPIGGPVTRRTNNRLERTKPNATAEEKRRCAFVSSTPPFPPSPFSLSPRSRASPVPIRLPGTPIEASSPVVVEFWSVYARCTVHPMSGFVLPDSDLDVGCCGCLGFLKKPDEDVDFEKVWMLSRGRKMAPLMLLTNRPLCREKPVKETKRLTLDRVSQAFYKSRLSRLQVTSTETAMTDVFREVEAFAPYLNHAWGRVKTILDTIMLLYLLSSILQSKKTWFLKPKRVSGVELYRAYQSSIGLDGNDVLCRSPGTPVFTAPECCLGYYSSRPQFLY